MSDHDVKTSLLVGCSAGTNPNETIVEREVGGHSVVLAACDIAMSATPWPFVQADATKLPFATAAADMVLAQAVIEHVGGEAEQRALVKEHLSVARTFVITTPNRWFPVESHTSTIFRHWSARWRTAQRAAFTRLLGLREFRDLMPSDAVIVGRWWGTTFTAFYPGQIIR